MATDATGTPTSPDNIPTYNTALDVPSGKGFNATMAVVQTALSLRAPLDSPTFIGIPLSVTPSTGDNSTKIATTAYVKAQGYGPAGNVTSVFGRTGVVVQVSGDYTAAQVTSAADKSATSIQSFAGGIKSTHATQGIGYATGAGGSATQPSSKSATVTLNKATGTIVMNSAALANNDIATFIFSNSVITSSDVIIVLPTDAGGVAPGSYSVQVMTISSGACFINVKNISGGSLSEALNLQFVVIKGAVA